MKLYIGKVTDNDAQNASDNDPLKGKTGAIQIKIDHLMYGLKSDEYPWFRPARSGTGGSSDFGTSCIPEVDSYVVCYFEEESEFLFKKGFYLWDLNLSGVHPHTLYEDNVKDTVSAESEYPDIKYIYLKSGICIAASSGDKPEITIFHPKFWLFINKDGYLKNEDDQGNKITINNNGILIEDKNGNKLEMGSSSVKINNNLEVLQ